MNKLIRKAAAVLTAGIVAATGLGATSFAANEELIASFTADYAATVSKPTYSVKGAKGYRYVRLSTATSGATIYYTTNGKTPTTSSKVYKAGSLLKITKNVQIRAIAVKGSSKSAVMTKTFKVATVLGDVTGDGKVNSNDYSRLKSYLNGKTSYICKDNADVNKSGTITSKDLTLLKQYINGDIKKFPTSDDEDDIDSTLSISPKITVYKTYGGKKIELSCSDSKATIYFTVNGKTPSKSTSKYTAPFVVDEDVTIKCVAYKSGSYGKVVTREVEVDKCESVDTDTPTSQNYKDSVKVKLSCDTDGAKIYYTLDGTDPIKNGYVYRNPIELTQDTTLKVAARAKGYADSDVKTYVYKVETAKFIISGVAWDDTPSATSKADGVKQSGEAGINGITVYLLNATTGETVATTTTNTINGIAGSYKFENIKKGVGYKVCFVYNCQKYRAYDYVVSGGNQAIPDNISAITIKSDGAYANGTKGSSANNYSAATADSKFNVAAKTSSVYYDSADNVNVALNTKVYGEMKIEFAPSSRRDEQGNTTLLSGLLGQKVYNNDTLTFTITVSNNSASQTLYDMGMKLYLDNDLQLVNIVSSNGNIISYSYSDMNSSHRIYDISGFASSGISPGYSLKLTVTAKVSTTADNATITNYVESTAYRYSGACYDKNITPGNMLAGTPKENDEAKTVELKVEKNVVESNKSLVALSSSVEVTVGAEAQEFIVVVKNGTAGINDVIISSGENAPFTYTTTAQTAGSDTYIHIKVTGVAAGSGKVTVCLKEDTTKSVTTNVVVKPAPETTAPTTPETPETSAT